MFHFEKDFDIKDYQKFQTETSSQEKFLYEIKQIVSLMYIVTDKVSDLQTLVNENDDLRSENFSDLKDYLDKLTMFSVETLLFSEDCEDQISSN